MDFFVKEIFVFFAEGFFFFFLGGGGVGGGLKGWILYMQSWCIFVLDEYFC